MPSASCPLNSWVGETFLSAGNLITFFLPFEQETMPVPPEIFVVPAPLHHGVMAAIGGSRWSGKNTADGPSHGDMFVIPVETGITTSK